jgi:hypothetical protein
MAMDISGNHTQMRSVGTRLKDDQYQDYKRLVDQIYNEVDSITLKWKGIDQTSFMNTILGKRPAMDELGKCIQGYGNFLIASSNYLKQAQDDVSDAASKL